MPERIYVQIPAYRDSELLPTVTDLLATAADPNRITVAICWQFGQDEDGVGQALERFPNVQVTGVPAERSQGCNWARQILQDRWDGEEYTLFLDSHHRFAPGWDAALVRMHRDLQNSGVQDPILTSYLPPYDPANDPSGRIETIYRMVVSERVAGMPFRLVGRPLIDWGRLTSPVPADFVSLHLLFADGDFNERVRFDPGVYFFADEIAVALRAFTHGYDLFHPHTIVGWHLYDRRTRTTHWTDHTDWRARHQQSIGRLRSLFAGTLRDGYGTGTARTITEYEHHANVTLITDGRPAAGGAAS